MSHGRQWVHAWLLLLPAAALLALFTHYPAVATAWGRVEVPAGLPPPPVVGFQRYTGLTENVQQDGDWVLRLPSGVRLHAHEFSNGRWTVHLDKFDPDHSLLYAVMHIASETSAARFAAYCTAIYFGYRWWVA